jgi:hypothetical protein
VGEGPDAFTPAATTALAGCARQAFGNLRGLGGGARSGPVLELLAQQRPALADTGETVAFRGAG